MKLIHKIFWSRVADDIEKVYGQGHPSHWTTKEVRTFLDEELLKSLQKISNSDTEKAKQFLIPNKLGEFSEVTIHEDTVRRLVVEQTSGGQTATREMFAIYLGYNSADHYRKVRHIYEEVEKLKKKAKEEEDKKIIEPLDEIKYRDKKNKKLYVITLSSMILIILSLLAIYFKNTPNFNCITDGVTKNQFVLVRTDHGITYIDPNKKINQVLAEGPHLTGFSYDQNEGLLFWSNTNHNYRTIGRANLSNGLIDEDIKHRFIKNLPCPVGITLDTLKNIIYLADYGDYNKLNDGSIRKYDYEGNLLEIIYQDSIDPSSIILDIKSQTLYWTDPRKGRIGCFEIQKNSGNPNFLVNLGQNPDGMALSNSNNRLYWANNLDSLIGWVNLKEAPLQPMIIKLHEPATALVINPTTGALLYTCHDQEKIKWLEINGDSLKQSNCGQIGIQTGAGSPGVIQLFTK